MEIVIVGLNFGVGMIEEIINGPGRDYFTVTGVYDLDQKRTEIVAAKYGVKAYEALDEVLNDDIPIIGLFTPPIGRAKLINQILDAGKDVITTKPFELCADEAEAVLRKAREMGRKIMLNSPSPIPSPDVSKILNWSNDYNLGRVIACRCDTWASYREQQDGKWYDDPKRCPVAPIFRIGIYLINDLVRIMGKARDVHVMHSRIFTTRPTPDNAQLSILFDNDAIANVFASFCIEDGQYYKASLILNFERGTITRNIGATNREQVLQESSLSLVTLDGEKQQIIQNEVIIGSSELYPWEDFHNILLGKVTIPMETDVAIVESIRVINAMAKAESSGRTEKVI